MVRQRVRDAPEDALLGPHLINAVSDAPESASAAYGHT